MKKNNAQTPKKAKVALTKQEVKVIKNRMSELKNGTKNSTQKAIPYIDMFRDGICKVTENYFTKTVQFYDITYRLATFDEKNSIFSKYCDLLNYFDNSIKFQLTFENQNSNVEDLLSELDIPSQEDDFNDIRKEYSEMLKNQLIQGTNGRVIKKFITFGIEADDLKSARPRLNSIGDEIIAMLENIGVKGEILKGKERLQVLYKTLNPFSNNPFLFDWNYRAKTGASTKDFIAPQFIKFYKDYFEMSNCYGSINTINILAGELSDEILYDYLSQSHLFSLNIHVKPFDQIEALKFIRAKKRDVEQMKIDEQKKAIKGGWDPDILPPDITMYIEELENMLADLNSKNERLFNITLTIKNYAESKKNMKLQQELLKRITQKNNCKISELEYIQEQALGSSLALGYNTVQINRAITTSEIAAFVPFTSQELFSSINIAAYYGLNSLSNNMIFADRKMLKNPNGLVLGTPGSGKSFSVKREIFDCFLKTNDDILICDPEGEYYPLVHKLKGQVIKISSNSKQHINPMDIIIEDINIDENPISMKSDFIISLMELIVGGGGITAEERSVIDRCVRQIYNRFFNTNPTPETMPLLSDLLEEFNQVGEKASRVANSLEMYVTGSQNVFNHRTNVDVNNRLVCFDIKDLGNQLKKLGMLILQDVVWSRVAINRGKKATRYYMDEFHLLLKDAQTAKYSTEMWKRFRKWGGMPTGITQNVKDLLLSQEIENIFDNSDFVYILNQSAGDREILADKLHISQEQIQYVTNSGQGKGLIRFGDTILPFKDEFPRDTVMYSLMTTNPNESKTV